MHTETLYENATFPHVRPLKSGVPPAARNDLATSARQDAALVGALEAADAMAMFSTLQADWQDHLAAFPQFADELEFADPYVCGTSQLAEMIAQAPTAAIRQVLREIAYCREQMALTLGLAAVDTDERAQVVLAGANAEWEILLGAHPTFSALLSTTDRFTCSRATLSELLVHAPTCTIRHALRETFCFREVAALITAHEFG